MTTPKWNPRYLAYARDTGTPDPDTCLERDRERWNGGSMTGFILWIGERWAAWYATNKFKPDWPKGRAEHASFDQMVGAVGIPGSDW